MPSDPLSHPADHTARDRAGWHPRRWVQLLFCIITILIGLQFAIFVHQVQSSYEVTVSRPPAVEGFLPIGALMAWKLFLTTGRWDPVHPAAMVILSVALLISFLLRKSFCSWICPVGCLSEWLWRLGKRITGRNFKLPIWLDRPLRGLKYILLGFFLWAVLRMDASGIFEFLQSPYYKISDVRMLHFFTRMSALSGGILLLLAIGSMAVRNFWCRFLCPYGALTGLLALIGPSHIHRRTDVCIGCGRCAEVCPAHLPVAHKTHIVSAECTGCLDCVQACPVAHTLAFKTLGPKGIRWTAKRLAAVTILIMVLAVATARITGHWQSQVNPFEIQMLVRQMNRQHQPPPGTGGN